MNLTINGITYSTTAKLDAFTQLHVARKLGAALPVVDGLVRQENAGKDKTLLSLLMLSNISDADADFVVKKCLGVVVRNSGNQPAKIQTPSGELMFDDISLAAVLDLAVAVIEENLGDFFRTSLGRLAQEEAQT